MDNYFLLTCIFLYLCKMYVTVKKSVCNICLCLATFKIWSLSEFIESGHPCYRVFVEGTWEGKQASLILQRCLSSFLYTEASMLLLYTSMVTALLIHESTYTSRIEFSLIMGHLHFSFCFPFLHFTTYPYEFWMYFRKSWLHCSFTDMRNNTPWCSSPAQNLAPLQGFSILSNL